MPDAFAAPNYLDKLTESQQEAVLHTEGPLLILAGPGSGKTRVITRRVAHLLQQGVQPGNILAITFTNKAAGEMRSASRPWCPATGVWISTFHSLGARLLRQYADRLGLDRNFTIYDQADRAAHGQESAGSRRHRQRPVHARRRSRRPSARPRTSCSARRSYAADGQATSSAHVVAQVYPAYEKKLRDANALDFDDLLYWPALALKNDEELRAELDARFRYVLIDEYQDTNQAQYDIAQRPVDRLSQPVRRRRPGPIDLQVARLRHPQHPRLRARLSGRPRHHAERELSAAPRRSCSAADNLIDHNKQRKAKPLFTDNAGGRAGPRLAPSTPGWTRPSRSPHASRRRSRRASAAIATSPSSCASTP